MPHVRRGRISLDGFGAIDWMIAIEEMRMWCSQDCQGSMEAPTWVVLLTAAGVAFSLFLLLLLDICSLPVLVQAGSSQWAITLQGATNAKLFISEPQPRDLTERRNPCQQVSPKQPLGRPSTPPDLSRPQSHGDPLLNAECYQ